MRLNMKTRQRNGKYLKLFKINIYYGIAKHKNLSQIKTFCKKSLYFFLNLCYNKLNNDNFQ